MATRIDICNTGLKLIGLPYCHQGRDEEIGGDCAYVPIYIAEKNSLPYADIKGYARIPDGNSLREILKNNTAKEKSLKDALPGDILLMRFTQEPQHIAILMPNNQILHSYMKAKKVVIHEFDQTWKNRVVSVFEFHNVE